VRVNTYEPKRLGRPAIYYLTFAQRTTLADGAFDSIVNGWRFASPRTAWRRRAWHGAPYHAKYERYFRHQAATDILASARSVARRPRETGGLRHAIGNTSLIARCCLRQRAPSTFALPLPRYFRMRNARSYSGIAFCCNGGSHRR